jgi:ATP-dependent helicase HepA
LAEKHEHSIVLEARSQMEKLQQLETDRLRALAEINPNIRPEEIAHLEEETVEMKHFLENTHTRLDALRVAVVTD